MISPDSEVSAIVVARVQEGCKCSKQHKILESSDEKSCNSLRMATLSPVQAHKPGVQISLISSGTSSKMICRLTIPP